MMHVRRMSDLPHPNSKLAPAGHVVFAPLGASRCEERTESGVSDGLKSQQYSDTIQVGARDPNLPACLPLS